MTDAALAGDFGAAVAEASAAGIVLPDLLAVKRGSGGMRAFLGLWARSGFELGLLTLLDRSTRAGDASRSGAAEDAGFSGAPSGFGPGSGSRDAAGSVFCAAADWCWVAGAGAWPTISHTSIPARAAATATKSPLRRA